MKQVQETAYPFTHTLLHETSPIMYFPLKVSIPEPCHEDWNKMEPIEINRRHCQSCEKVVTDFTNMTDVQIGNHLRKGGNLCGRFRKSQLDRRIAVGGPRRFSGLRAAAAASGLLFAVPAAAQTLPDAPTHQVDTQIQGGIKANTTKPTDPTLKGNVRVSGKVTDSDGEGLIGASVLLQGTTTGTITDIDGLFTIEVPADSSVILALYYTGFSTETVFISAEDIQKARSEAEEQGKALPVLEMGPLVCVEIAFGEVFYAGEISYHRPSLVHRIFVTPVRRYIVSPVRKLSYNIREWKAERRETRKERKAERLAKKASRQAVPQDAPPTAPETKQVQEVESRLQLQASPNPFTDHLRVSFNLPTEQDYTLELTSVTGQIITRKAGKGIAGLQEVKLGEDVSALPSGTYYLRLQAEEGLFSVKTLVR